MYMRHLLVPSFLVLAGGSTSAVGDTGCGAVTQAFDALRNAPAYHMRMEATASDRKFTMEQVVNGDAMFMKDPKSGTWHKLPISAEQRRKTTEELMSTHPVRDCNRLGTASVDGTSTTIYQFVQTTTLPKGGQLTEQDVTKKMYIGAKDGRVYRIDSATSQQRPISVVYDYTNVQPPTQ